MKKAKSTIIEELVKQNPGCTNIDLSEWTDLTPDRINHTLSYLQTNKRIRKTGDKPWNWYIVEKETGLTRMDVMRMPFRPYKYLTI